MNRSPYKTTLQNKLWLVQTDTTVGFLSQDGARLARVKERPLDKPFVLVTASFKTLKTLCRIPKIHKRLVRRSEKTTFAYANAKAVRVVKDARHASFIKPFKWFYSTSANEKALVYSEAFAFSKSDIIIETAEGLYEGEASRIYRLGRSAKKRMR